KLLEKNLNLTEEIYVMTKKIKGHLTFQRFVSIFYLIMFIAPIILGIIYLPTLLNGVISQYESVLDISPGDKTDLLNNLLKK
ncbi:MAG: hypothetical protein Q7T79_01250, partial [bacterium]|nr:hypothetical protein [bacterium]